MRRGADDLFSNRDDDTVLRRTRQAAASRLIHCRVDGGAGNVAPLTACSAAGVADSPFPHLVRTDALPDGLYERLASSFPGLAALLGGRTDVGSNRAVRRTATAALADPALPGLWRDFLAYHTSAAYWHDVVRVFGAHLRAAFPDLERRRGRAFADWRVAVRGTEEAEDADVRLDCQFVMNTPVVARSSVKTPHVDRYDKIFSALLYMRDPADRAAGSDLDLYAWRRAPRFLKHRVLEHDVERVATVPYAANTYVAFVNSPRAVHGVSPRDPTTVPRRYVNFVAEVPGRAFEPPQMGRLQRLWRRPADEAEERY